MAIDFTTKETKVTKDEKEIMAFIFILLALRRCFNFGEIIRVP